MVSPMSSQGYSGSLTHSGESLFRHAIIGLTAISWLSVTPAPLAAQTKPVPLSERLPQLYKDVIETRARVFDGFTGDAREVISKARLDAAFQVNDLLAAQLSSFPLGSSAGGFTWTFEPVSGTFTRASDSFGPIFAERALTIGRNRLNVGMNYQRVTFDHLEGKSLRGGEIIGYTGLPLLSGQAGMFFADSLDLEATTQTATTFATYGVSDRLDVGVAVPVNHVELKATLNTRFDDNRGWGDDYIRIVAEHGLATSASSSGSASGLGDIVVRAKYNVLKRNGGGLAGAVDVRLPTGDESNLLGIAGTQTKVYMIGSRAFSRLSPHFNFGYTISGGSPDAAAEFLLIAPADEINYTAGADMAVSLRTTVAVGVVGRTLRQIGTLSDASTRFGGVYKEFELNRGADLHLLLGSAGLKVNPTANMLMSTNVLFPLRQRGLTDRLTWLVSFDYSF